MLLTLFSASTALAHVDVQPRLVEQGTDAVLQVELPLLRAGGPPARLEVEGDGVESRGSTLVGVVGAETRWRIRLRVDSSPGEVLLILRAVFADGESVEVDGSIVVVPRAVENDDAFPWAGVAAGLALALALAAVALLFARRRGDW